MGEKKVSGAQLHHFVKCAPPGVNASCDLAAAEAKIAPMADAAFARGEKESRKRNELEAAFEEGSCRANPESSQKIRPLQSWMKKKSGRLFSRSKSSEKIVKNAEEGIAHASD